MGYRVAVVGATKDIGRQTLKILAERNFPLSEIKAVSPSLSTGQQISFGEDAVLDVMPITDFDFHGFDFAFFSAGNLIAADFVPLAAEAGCVVIDTSHHFSQEPEVPLIIPEVNPHALANYKKCNIVASPNPIILPLVMALKPLHDEAKIKRVVVSTYQSVSDVGQPGMDELFSQTRSICVNQPIVTEEFSKQIAFNIIPQTDGILTTGQTSEEERILLEIKKILDSTIRAAVTCTRVPVFIGHSMAVAVELEKPLSVGEARALWREFPGLSIVDFRQEDGFVTPVDVVGEDTVFISRIRQDKSVENGLLFWLVNDNLRKGTALNAVQIAETIIKDYF